MILHLASGPILCLILNVAGFNAVVDPNERGMPDPRSYSSQHLLEYLRAHGYPDDRLGTLWQDSDGLRVYVAEWRRRETRNLWVLSAERGQPEVISRDPPPRPEMYGWMDLQGETHYLPAHAFPEDYKEVFTRRDLQSGYFFQIPKDSDTVYVGHYTHHGGWILTLEKTDEFRPDQICAWGDRIYLLDHRNRDRPAFKTHDAINCWVFAPVDEEAKRYEKVDEFSVAGEVLRVDPFYPRFFCKGYGDKLFPGRRFLFDLDEKEIISGPRPAGLVLFLEDDWLGARLDE